MFRLVTITILLLLVSVCVAQNKFDKYGVPKQGYPNWQERATLVLTNVARMSPSGYKLVYAPSLSATMLPVTPLFEHYDLDRSARFHSNDMYTNNCFQHNSCDGTDTFVRIKSFYSESGTLAENIASGYSTPQDVVRGWINSAGHRTNIMNGNYKVMGNGYVSRLWTQNFAGGPTTAGTPIVAAAHFNLNATHMLFLANVFNATLAEQQKQPRSVFVFMDNSKYDMTLNASFAFKGNFSTGHGTFASAVIAKANGCGNYTIVVYDNSGNLYRYPPVGQHQTYDGSSCNSFYTAIEAPPLPVSSSPAPLFASSRTINLICSLVAIVLPLLFL